MTLGTIEYTYRGNIERGNGKPGYDWVPGYSETGPNGEIFAPYMTVRECQREAASRKCRAVFVEEPVTTKA